MTFRSGICGSVCLSSRCATWQPAKLPPRMSTVLDIVLGGTTNRRLWWTRGCTSRNSETRLANQAPTRQAESFRMRRNCVEDYENAQLGNRQANGRGRQNTNPRGARTSPSSYTLGQSSVSYSDDLCPDTAQYIESLGRPQPTGIQHTQSAESRRSCKTQAKVHLRLS